MKKNFKKSVAVIMTMLMLLSVMGVCAFAATYKLEYLPGRYSTDTAPAAIQVEGGTTVTLAGALFTREGYVQTGWSTAQAGTKKNYELGASLTIKKNTKLYPYWEANKIVVTFAPGADGIGAVETAEANEGDTVKFPGAIFTREDYIQIGWTSVDGGALEFGLTDNTPAITAPVTFYPVWEKCDYTVEANLSTINFGTVCINYPEVASETLVITNVGNTAVTYTLPSNPAYSFTVTSGSLVLEAGKSVEIEITPAMNLDAGNYNSTLVFECDYAASSVSVNARFTVKNHSYTKYTSNNDATYESDGTKTAYCTNNCGASDTIDDIGSKKIYSADNNGAIGLSKEYLHHRTVRFTAFGSGMDDELGVVGKRFVPTTWYVTEEFNGAFENGYDIVFTHTVFGNYTLTINYVEEEYNEETKEWVATGVTDEKTFDYVVGTNEYEEQEVVRPNTILSIIFGLFAQLLALLGLGG